MEVCINEEEMKKKCDLPTITKEKLIYINIKMKPYEDYIAIKKSCSLVFSISVNALIQTPACVYALYA